MLTKVAEWLESHKWKIAAVAVIAAIAVALWYRDCSLRQEVSSLRSEYAQSLEKVKALEAETARLKRELEIKVEEIEIEQQKNDAVIKEAGENAYADAIALPDDSLLDAFNELISGARSRNEKRRGADTGDE